MTHSHDPFPFCLSKTHLFLTLQEGGLVAPQVQQDSKAVHLLVAVAGDVKVSCRVLEHENTYTIQDNYFEVMN